MSSLPRCWSFRMLLGFSAIFYNIIPRSEYPFYGSLISSVTTASVLCGPLLGGLIDTYTTWRWIFYINVPGVGIIIAVMSLLLPAKFPYHGPQPLSSSPPNMKKNLSSILEKIDFFGTFLLLGGSLLLITPLLGVNSTFTWSSPVVISLLTISAIFWVAFVAWEWFLGTRQTKQVPIVPWQMLTNRLWMGIAL
jgi:MFS family permease